MKQIISTTDGCYIGVVLDVDAPINLDGFVFAPDKITALPDGTYRLSNSNYVIDVKDA